MGGKRDTKIGQRGDLAQSSGKGQVLKEGLEDRTGARDTLWSNLDYNHGVFPVLCMGWGEESSKPLPQTLSCYSSLFFNK